MAERLKNTLAFDLAPGASVDLVHGLCTSRPRPLGPDIVFIPSPSLSVTATTLVVTLTNDGGVALSGDILVEAWHTIERAFSDTADEDLPVKPYIVVSAEQGNAPPQPPYADPNVNVVIYARATGNDDTGDGKTIPTAYRTLQRAVRDVPNIISPGVSYTIDCTGIGQETLPDGYELPAWKAPLGFMTEVVESELFDVRGAVNITAYPKLSTSLSAANAVITEADLVPTDVGGGIADVAAFNDVRNSGNGNGTTDAFADEGDGIASLQIAGESFDVEGVSLITITGSPSPANDGTFPVVGADGDKVFYENPAVVAEAAFAGTYETFTPFIYVETNDPHGLWNVEFPAQTVTIDGVTGSIGAVVNGDHEMIWRTVNTFIFQIDEDATSLAYINGGTVSVLFVQDTTSGHVQIKTTKNFGADDSLVGQLVVNTQDAFFGGVIWRNTVDTLFISLCFAPNAFGVPIDTLRVSEQSAELLTTCSFITTGSRRGQHRGGLTIANVDSMTLNGFKVTPINEGEPGLLQQGGGLITQWCQLPASSFNNAEFSAARACYFSGASHGHSMIDLERCFYVDQADSTFAPPTGWAQAYFGTVFHNVIFSFDSPVQTGLFACKFYDQGAIFAAIGGGRNDWDNVSFENIEGGVFLASSAISRSAITRCNGTVTSPDSPMVFPFNGGAFLIRSNDDPFGDASFTNPGDFMLVDGLPPRTFEDFRQHPLLDLGPLTANFDTVFEQVDSGSSPATSMVTIQVIGDSGAGVVINYNPVTRLVEIHFEDGVSTVLDAENAVGAFAFPDEQGIRVKTPGAPGNVLVAPGDEIAATLFDVGVNGPCGEYTAIFPNPNPSLGAIGRQSTILAYSLPA